jgi:serine/threonine protein phosphatase PrpC
VHSERECGLSYEIEHGFASQSGQREVNEDFAAVRLPQESDEFQRGVIAAIADGVSAGGGGLEAAQTSVMVLLEDFVSAPPTWETTVALDRILSAQNAWLHAQNSRSPAKQRATTLTAVVLRGQTYTVAHVGDTRAYLVRDNSLECLTSDHAHTAGSLRSMLTRALGVDERVLIDYAQGDLRLDDQLVLVSDGVWNALPDRLLREEVAGKRSAQALAERLTALALERGSDDNVTALVIRVKGLPTADLRSTQAHARTLAVPRRLRIGELIDGLAVTQVVADNGIHLLYQVRDVETRKLYALKTVHPNRGADPEEIAGLAHEAWLSERMDGAHFVRSHRRPGASQLYILYDWHSGETLEHWLAHSAPLPIDSVLSVVVATLKGLSRMHRQGIVHRDIKPANLHRDDDGVLRIIDLGVAISGAEPASIRELHAGTPSFINPEQWEGAAPDAAADLFAVGITLYQLLTGKFPYGDIEPYQLGRYKREATAPSRLRPEIALWLEALMLKAVARDPKLRFETTEEFILAIERGAARPVRAPGSSPLLIRDRLAGWQIALAVSLFVNLLLLLLVLTVGK